MFGRRHMRILDRVQAQFRARQLLEQEQSQRQEEDEQQVAADAVAPPDPAPLVLYTRRDVYHIAFLLNQVFLPELVPSILSFAEVFEWQRYVDDRRACIEEYTSPSIRLIVPISSCTRTANPVQRVVFTIRSRDQGWADDDNGNWTWYSAAIQRCNDDETNGNTSHTSFFSSESDSEANPSALPNYDLSYNITEHNIVHNYRADNSYHTQVVEWRHDSSDPAIRAWMACLVPGRLILVKAWARYPGWQNYVESIKVDVWSSVLIGQTL